MLSGYMLLVALVAYNLQLTSSRAKCVALIMLMKLPLEFPSKPLGGISVDNTTCSEPTGREPQGWMQVYCGDCLFIR